MTTPAKDTWMEQIARIRMVFTPNAPIEDRDLFAGRLTKIGACVTVANSKGAHGILYGDRGVGKTSLMNIVSAILVASGFQTLKCACNTADTYDSIWRKIFSQLVVEREAAERLIGIGRAEDGPKERVRFSDAVQDGKYSPDTVLGLLHAAPKPLVVIIDEFDRLDPKQFDRRLFTDTLKLISDSVDQVTLIMVGVGDNVDEIIGDHQSVERNLKQISMPVMTTSELSDILVRGLGKLEMTMDDEVASRIVAYSCGYPHYAHLLALHACSSAVIAGTSNVGRGHLDGAVESAIVESNESLRTAYRKATQAVRGNIYTQVLWACGAVNTDEYGTFQAKDLEPHLSVFLNKSTKVNQFGGHLNKLASEERGEILVQVGGAGRIRYKFKNPLMRAFVQLSMHG